MTMRKTDRRLRPALLIAAILLATVAAARAQSGAGGDVVRAGDVLQMVVPGRPDLDRSLVVDAAGNVDIPQVGEVRLGGLELRQAGILLKQRLRLIAPTLDTVELTRAEAATLRIYVLGQVGRPGTLQFPGHPTVWDVLREAGGPLPTADLRQARVIREEDGKPGTVPVDLSRMLEGEEFPDIDLRDGDTLVIPALATGVSGVESERGVKVFGGVGVPSIVPVTGPTRLMDVLMLAGSPTVDANLQKVWWVHADGGEDQAEMVNMRKFLEQGNLEGNPLVHPGDTVNVTVAHPGKLQQGITLLLGMAVAMSTIYLAVNSANN